MSSSTDSLIALLVGGALLFFGSRYYWLVAGGVGFLFGTNLGSAPDGGVITGSALAMGILFGFIAAVASVFITKFALSISGFVMGGILMVRFMEALGWDLGSTFAAFLIGGILGLVLVIVSQEWALIFLSVITGAAIIVNVLVLDPASAQFVYIVLVILGFTVQLFLNRRKS
ncbi:MAG: hypothetical protein IAF02_06030 [Anaerolineae bacterium]|nr:hypothetical protein [Anaerolineae bacterium]